MRNGKIRNSESGVFFGILTRYFDEKKGAWRFALNFKRLALVLVGTAAFLWIAAAVAVFCGFKYLRKYENISFLEVLQMPFATDRYRIEMGESQIAAGRECLKKGDYQGAFMNMAGGVARSPDNLEGRVFLAQMYQMLLRDSERAAETLDFKIAKAFDAKDKTYLKLSISIFALSNDYRKKAAMLAARCADSGVLSPEETFEAVAAPFRMFSADRRFDTASDFASELLEFAKDKKFRKLVAQNGAVAMISNSENQRAIDTLKKAEIYSGEVLVLATAADMIDRGREISALKLINVALKSAPNKAACYEVLARICDDFGDEAGAKNAKKFARLTSGNIAEAELLSIESKSGSDALEAAKKFAKNNPDKIQNLALAATRNGNADIIDFCLERKQPPHTEFTLKLAKAEVYIAKGNPNDALAALDSARFTDFAKYRVKSRDLFTGYEIAINALSSKNVSEQIETYINAAQRQPAEVSSLINLLRRSKLHEQALFAAEKGLSRFPKNPKIAASYCDCAADANDLNALATAADKYQIKLPVKYAAVLGGYVLSDKNIFMDEAKIKVLAKKADIAKQKITQYKNIYGNF